MSTQPTVAELEDNRARAAAQLHRGQWPPDACPRCGRTGIQHHSKSAWCLRCSWATNRPPA